MDTQPRLDAHSVARPSAAPRRPAHTPPARAERQPPASSPARDLDLARAALRGETEARCEFSERMRCVPRMIAGLNRRRAGILSQEDVEDLAQDVVLMLWRKLGQFHGKATLEMWAGRACFLEFMNRLRSQDRSRALGRRQDAADLEVEDPREGSAGDADALELAARAERRLDSLPEAMATVIRLKHFGKLTLEEISRALGVSANTVKTRYYRGLARLQEDVARLRRTER